MVRDGNASTKIQRPRQTLGGTEREGGTVRNIGAERERDRGHCQRWRGTVKNMK